MTKPLPDAKYIQFINLGPSKSGRTTIWHVAAKDDKSDLLGEVRWFGPWRCYSFYAYNAYFEKQCLRDIANFCEEQTKLHKQKTVPNKKSGDENK